MNWHFSDWHVDPSGGRAIKWGFGNLDICAVFARRKIAGRRRRVSGCCGGRGQGVIDGCWLGCGFAWRLLLGFYAFALCLLDRRGPALYF